MDIADRLLRAMHNPGRPLLWTAADCGRLIHQPPGVALFLLGIAERDGLVERVRHRFWRLTSPATALLEVQAVERA